MQETARVLFIVVKILSIRSSDHAAGSGFLFEVFLAYAAERTFPIIGKIRKKGAGLNAVIGIADFFVVDVAADCAYKLCHTILSFCFPSSGKRL